MTFIKFNLLAIWFFTLPIFFSYVHPSNTTNNPPLNSFDPCTGGNIGGNVWTDYNADGIQDSNETVPVEGVVVEIYDSNNTLVG